MEIITEEIFYILNKKSKKLFKNKIHKTEPCMMYLDINNHIYFGLSLIKTSYQMVKDIQERVDFKKWIISELITK